MKVNISLDGSPDEVRAFFGWPPVAQMHDELWKKMQEQMSAGAPGYDPASIMKNMMPDHMQNMMPDQLKNMMNMQQAFWQQMAQQQADTDKSKK